MQILSTIAVRRGLSSAKDVYVGGKTVEGLPHDGSMVCLGRKTCLREQHDVELEQRIARGWAKFATHEEE